MCRYIVTILIVFVLLLFSSTKSLAIYDPASTPNNRFGIHITNEKDLENAAKLVNSSGGDWGYVTVVITENDRSGERWQKFFDQMRRLHLIPIVRIASKPESDIWSKPNINEVDNWVTFLDSLNWVTRNRYVIIGNEPNHAKEWGGSIGPLEYAEYLKAFSQKLKAKSGDFFVLPAGLDASASNTKDTMDEVKFLKMVVASQPEFGNFIDGWVSHSYPNPDFSGSELAMGKGTIRTYLWELSYLNDLGINKSLPVFITETGWSNEKLSDQDVAKKIEYSFSNVWNDPKVVAVTPFILNYTEPPFSQFSWVLPGGALRTQFLNVEKMQKISGQPKQLVRGELLFSIAQPLIPVGSDFFGIILAKNTGQSIWNFNDISIGSENNNPFIKSYSFNDLEPGNLGVIVFKAKSPDYVGIYSSSIFLKDRTGARISNNFPLEAAVAKFQTQKIRDFIVNIFTGLNLQFGFKP